MHARGSPEAAAVSTSQPPPLRRLGLGLGLIVSGFSLLFAPPLASAAAVNGQTGLVRRGGARLTYYDVGQGACGGYNEPGDFVVAINSQQWDGGSHCNKMITISAGGKQTEARIVDECPGCPFGGLDLSEGLFSYFADIDEGMMYGAWHFGSADPEPKSQPHQPQPDPKTAHVQTNTLRINNAVAAHSTKVGGLTTYSASKTKAPASLLSHTATSDASATRSAASAFDALQSAQAPTPDMDIDSSAADPSATGEISTSGAPSTAADQGTAAFTQGAVASTSGATGLQDINWALISVSSLVLAILNSTHTAGLTQLHPSTIAAAAAIPRRSETCLTPC